MARIRVGDSDVYHEISGSGPPLLLLHGGFCSLESMRPQIASLSASFTVHAAERPGHGRTADVGGPFTYERGLGDVFGYVDAVGLGARGAGPVHVVGFSDGANLGLMLALRNPGLVRSLVLISANLDPSGMGAAGEDVADMDAGEHLGELAEKDPNLERYERLSPDGPEHADVVFAKLWRLWTTEPRIPLADLASVAVPTLVMAGEHDAIRPEHTRSIAEAIPGATLRIIPGATHGVMEERPELVNAAMLAFHDALPPSR